MGSRVTFTVWMVVCCAASIIAGAAGCQANPCGRTGERCCAAKDPKQQCKLGVAGLTECKSNRCCMVARTPDQAALEKTVQSLLSDRRGAVIGCVADSHCCDEGASCQKLTGNQFSVGICCTPSGKACAREGGCCNPEESCVGGGEGQAGVCQLAEERNDSQPQMPVTPPGPSTPSTPTAPTTTLPPTAPPTTPLPGLEVGDRLKRCEDSRDALECTNLHRCGWCDEGNGSGRCLEGDPGASNQVCAQGQWRYLPADVGNDDCNTQNTCGACVRASPCGWCAGAGRCVRGTSGGPDQPINGCEVTSPQSASQCKPEEDEWMFTTYECDLNHGQAVNH